MARKRRKYHQPSTPRVIPDPAEKARIDGKGSAIDWGVNVEALELPANAEVEAKIDRGMVTGRWRYDCFELLYRRRQRPDDARGHEFPDRWYEAIRRFQRDLAILHRTQGAGDAIRVTGKGSAGALAVARDGDEAALIQFVTTGFGLVRVQAGERVNDVLARLTKVTAKLLLALCEPEIASGSSVNWHATLRRFGYTSHNVHGAAIRYLCRDLADAYAEIDNQPRRAVG